uniref:Uncharacterized protein n=1 Tax=Anopheles minimus TaxID=112268 RepID=A0A182WQ07_9DIPT
MSETCVGNRTAQPDSVHFIRREIVFGAHTETNRKTWGHGIDLGVDAAVVFWSVLSVYIENIVCVCVVGEKKQKATRQSAGFLAL